MIGISAPPPAPAESVTCTVTSYWPAALNAALGAGAVEFGAPPSKLQLYESGLPFAPDTVALKLTAPPVASVVFVALAVTVSRPPSNTSIEIGWLDCTSSR